MKNKKLNRDTHARTALFKGQLASLIAEEEIKTTAGIAKVVRSHFEKLLTKARSGSVHARRQVQAVIQDRVLVRKLVADIAPRFADVRGGYLTLTVIGRRKGDNAPVVRLALTKKAVAPAAAKSAKSKAGKSAKAEPTPVKPAQPGKVNAPLVAKPTAAAKVSAPKSAIGTKRGER